MEMPRTPSRTLCITLTALFFVVTFLTYGSSLHNKFVSWDDETLIVENPIVRSMTPASVAKAFTSYDPELYIPLTFATYQIDHAIGGMQPFLFHCTDLVLHTINALLVAWLLFLLLGDGWVAAGLGLLFAVHPLNTEAVAWASARKDTLSTAFMLGSMISYLFASERGDKTLGIRSVALFALALLSKVSVVTMPVLLIILDLLRGRKTDRTTILEKWPYFALSVVFGIIALFGKAKVIVSSTYWQKFLMAAKSGVFYIGQFFWPHDLSVVYPYTKTIEIASADFIVPLVLTALLAAVAVYTWNRWRICSLAIAFYFVSLAPSFLNLAKGGDFYFASDRYAYVPMIGLLLILGDAVSRWLRSAPTVRGSANRKRDVAVLAVLTLVFLSTRASTQAAVWKNSSTLYAHAIAVYPNSRAAHNNLGMELLIDGQTDKAIDEFNASLAIERDPRTLVNLAAAEVKKNMLQDALALYQEVIALDPSLPDAPYGIGNIDQKTGKLKEAAVQYEKAIAIDPTYLNAYNNLGAVYVLLKDWKHATETLESLIERKPDFVEAYYNLALAYQQLGNAERAETLYRKAIELNPDDSDSLANLATILYDKKLIDDAAGYLKLSLNIDASNPSGLALLLRMKHDGVVR